MDFTKTSYYKRERLATLEFGKVAYYSKRKTNLVELEICIYRYEDKIELSICGGIWNSKHTDYVCCGQCLDTIYELKGLKNKATFLKLYDYWKEYHLKQITEEQLNDIKKIIEGAN